MKTRWNNLLLILFLGIGVMLTSCSNNDLGKESKTDEPENETGYFSLKLSVSRDPAGETTRPEEEVVKSGIVLLYDPYDESSGRDPDLKYRFELDIDNSSGVFMGDDVSESVISSENGFITKAREVERQDYLMLVALNQTHKMMDNTIVGTSKYSDFMEAKSSDPSDYGKSEGGNPEIYTEIAMTNARGPVTITRDMFHDTKEEAEIDPAQPQVAVDRILAKIILMRADNLTLPDQCQFADISWAADITNKLTYWMRKCAKTAPSYNGGVMETPLTPRDYIYAEDPNWDEISELRKQGGFVPLTGHFNYLEAPAGDFKNELSETPGDYAWEYVLENTMDAEEQWEDVTTRILIKANFIPQRTELIPNIRSNDSFLPGESYYYYRGSAFAHHEIQGMLHGLYAWPMIPWGLETAVRESTNFDFDRNDEPDESEEGAGGLCFFKNGVSYYSILIRHFDEFLSGEKNGYGRYGVVRNNTYKITITKVNGPGLPAIPVPESPDDNNEGVRSVAPEAWMAKDGEIILESGGLSVGIKTQDW